MNATPTTDPRPAQTGFCVALNGEPHTLREPTSLADLLAHLGHDQGSLATAINGDFVPRCSRAARWLRAGDQITCFQPIVGG